MHCQARYRVSWNTHKDYLCSCSTCTPKNPIQTQPESLFHKVVGLQPAVLLKKILQLSCFPVNFHKFLKSVFHRTSQGDHFLKFFFRFIMACKWIVRIAGGWRIVIHKYIHANQSIKTLTDSMWCCGQMLT